MEPVFDRDFAPRVGEAEPVAPGVRRVTAPNAGLFTFTGTNTFLIGADELAVLDPGPDDPAHVAALLRAIGGARVSHILVSHTHCDHSPAARPLQAATGAPILAAGPHALARPPHPGEDAMLDGGADRDFRPDIVVSDGDILRVDGIRIEAIATPGHAANHMAFALPDSGVMLSGDHVMGWATTVVAPPEGSMRDYMESLDRLMARPERLYLPAHGGPVRDAHAYMRRLHAHRRARETGILARLAAGDATIGEIVRRIYPAIDPRLAGAAALSTLAHLEALAGRGVVACEGPPGLAGRYRLMEAGEAPAAVATGTVAAGALGSG